MIGATTLALFFVPLFYVLISRASERLFPQKPAAAADAPAPPADASAAGTDAGGH